MKIIKALSLLVLLILFAFRIWQTTGCQEFVSRKFEPIRVIITVESHTNLDQFENRNYSRLYHNKVSTGAFEFLKTYALNFEPIFLLEILGPLGLLLVATTTLRIIKLPKNNKLQIVLLAIILTVALSLTSLKTTRFTLVVYMLCLQTYALLGVKIFPNANKKNLLIFTVLLIFTFWYYSISWQLPNTCAQIFFN